MSARRGGTRSADPSVQALFGVPTSAPADDSKPISVSQLAAQIQRALESHIGRVRVEGEISNLRVPASGHAYFALKDSDASINAVCFRSTLQSIRVALADGKKIEVSGKVSAYTARSEYQIVVTSIREAGVGDLMRRLMELQEKLKAEGIFDAARKVPLPRLPRVIGLVTSATGAALQDMLNVLRRRAGGLEIILSPCAVQGEAAPAEIVRAIKRLERDGRSQVIIAGRGGGSMEDLWAFNDERVVRAFAACAIPIVSAVGHEIDTTLSDHAADLRAPTPSAAAEIVTAHYTEAQRAVSANARSLDRSIRAMLDSHRATLDSRVNSWGFRRPIDRLTQAMQRADDLGARIDVTVLRGLQRRRVEFNQLAARLDRYAPARRVEQDRQRLEQLRARLRAVRPDLRWLPRLEFTRGQNVQLGHRLDQALRRRISDSRMSLASAVARLESVGPNNVLKRGYSFITTPKGDRVITGPNQAKPGQTLRVHSAQGQWRVAALGEQDEMFDNV